ncbi:MAG: hypothetical protein IT426_02985 [Pirellulales bacterium]|nr:hypothetical protein [Pirellulales bacterium]
MTNYERLCRTLQGESVDRLMTWDYIDNEAILARCGGYDPSKQYTFEELFAVNSRAIKSIGLDMTRGIYNPALPWLNVKVANWARFLGVDPRGWQVSQSGGTGWISKRPFSDLRGLEKHLPRPPIYEEVSDWFKPLISQVKEMADKHDIAWVQGVEGPLSDSYIFTDMELFLTAATDAPELIRHIIECMTQFSTCIARIYTECATSPLFFMGEDICHRTGPIVSPVWLRANALPQWRRIMAPIRARGFKFIFHTDGRYGPALPLILGELDADGLHPIERNGCNDIFEIREKYPHKFLFGNVCCSVTLPQGNPFDVEDETLELIERLGPRARCFIGSSSEVHNLVPLENAATMYRTVHEYGTYPLNVDRIQKRRRAIGGKKTVGL